jgi:hypothetical protein
MIAACQKSGSSGSGEEASSVPPFDGKPISDQTAQGIVNGHQWTFMQGRALVVTRGSATFLEIRLWDDAYANPCKEPIGSDFQIRATAPSTPGYWQVSSDPFSYYPSIIFSDLTEFMRPTNNMVANVGKIQILTIGPGTVSGRIQGSFSGLPGASASEVIGSFEVPYCGTQNVLE